MLIWLLNAVFRFVDFALGLALIVVPAYYVLRLVMPGNKYVQLAGKYLEKGLSPVTAWVRRAFSRLNVGFDISPLVIWIALILTRWILRLLRGILL